MQPFRCHKKDDTSETFITSDCITKNHQKTFDTVVLLSRMKPVQIICIFPNNTTHNYSFQTNKERKTQKGTILLHHHFFKSFISSTGTLFLGHEMFLTKFRNNKRSFMEKHEDLETRVEREV